MEARPSGDLIAQVMSHSRMKSIVTGALDIQQMSAGLAELNQVSLARGEVSSREKLTRQHCACALSSTALTHCTARELCCMCLIVSCDAALFLWRDRLTAAHRQNLHGHICADGAGLHALWLPTMGCQRASQSCENLF